MQLPLQLQITGCGYICRSITPCLECKRCHKGTRPWTEEGTGARGGGHGSCTKFAGTCVLTTVYECPKPSVSYFLHYG